MAGIFRGLMNAVLYAFVIGLHVLICFILIVVVLLQQGKGDSGALMGGSSQTVFGSRGPTTFFHYLTGGAASLFLVTSLFLSCTPSPNKPTGTVLGDDDDGDPSAEASATPDSGMPSLEEDHTGHDHEPGKHGVTTGTGSN